LHRCRVRSPSGGRDRPAAGVVRGVRPGGPGRAHRGRGGTLRAPGEQYTASDPSPGAGRRGRGRRCARRGEAGGVRPAGGDAGVLHEVLAARTEDEADRSAHLESSTRHRTRAQGLAGAAEEDGAPVVARQAVYALPGGTLDDRTAGMLPTQLAQGLLVTHLAVVGAAPFERRPLSIAAALEEAGELASLRAELEPVPSLVPEDQDLAPQDEEPEAG